MKKRCLSALVLGFLFMTTAALAADFPDKPVRIISPFSAGDAIDNTARVIAERMQGILKTPVIVQNIAGGGGAVGLAEAKRAPADGYTLVMASTGALTAGPLISDSGFVPEDFIPLGRLVTMPLAVAVRTESPYQTLDDLVRAGKEKKLTYATPGASSKQRIAMTQFAKENGMSLAHVAGKSGNEAATKAMTGEVDFVCTPLAVFDNLAKAGKLRVLAVASDKRADYMPDVPTFREAGYAPLDNLWFGLLVNRNVPPQVLEKLRAAVREAATNPETQKVYQTLRFEDGYLDGDAFAAVIRANIDNHQVILKEIGLIK